MEPRGLLPPPRRGRCAAQRRGEPSAVVRRSTPSTPEPVAGRQA